MFKPLDDLDRALLQSIEHKPGSNIREVIKPFFSQRSEHPLRKRVEALEIRGLIKLEHTKNQVLCYPAEVTQ
jgi:hypothetical protein